ncbi:MAG TPA: bifunctional sulfate adenylyltransferase/adenylylsulfate kinase [Patescibacteria group bacterium]|nr:bifunctional sulfate adenylyltransferase/adenylylsulfate kinase [Patescibacteria group bacterium]
MHEHSEQLISPYGGTLVNLIVPEEEGNKLKKIAAELPTLTLSDRALCDLEMLATGAFSPLTGFMGKADYESVLKTMRLANQVLFPMPITLPVDTPYAPGEKLSLRDNFGNLLAIMTVDEVYTWEPEAYLMAIFGTNDKAHPLYNEVMSWGPYNIAGKLEVLALPDRKDFAPLRLTPAETRKQLQQLGKRNVVAFQTRNPLHRAHEELTKRAAKKINGTLLLHPAVGMTKPGDVDHITRVRCYKVLIENHYEEYETLLALMPLAMRMAGPREALWHALIRRNYGASHFIVGRDHAGAGKKSDGKLFYDPYEAQRLAKQYESELGINILTFNEMVYLPNEDRYVEAHEVPPGAKSTAISGTQVRDDYLAVGRLLPPWFSRPEVASILAAAYSPILHRGFCVWFTGLSGAGKSTIAQGLESALQEQGRRVTLLDGDLVRQHLSKGLGFSKEDRDTNVLRVGFVASQVAYHGGAAICALISPYEQTREAVRKFFEQGKFIEVYVSTPLDVCKQRDPKGHYLKASKGLMPGFTGLDDAYEPPSKPDLTIDTAATAIDDSITIILDELKKRSLLA